MIFCCESYLSITGNPYLVGRPGGAKELIRQFDEAGITGAITLASGADAVDNRDIREAMDAYPGRIFGCFWTRNRGKEAVDAFRVSVRQWGFKCIKMSPSAETGALARAAADLDIPIMVHTGGESWTPATQAFYAKIAELARTYPRLPIIMEHMGYRYSMDLANETARRHSNLYLGTTIPAASEPILVKKAIQEVGAEKVLFGSNAPWANACLGVEGIRRLKLGKENEKLVFSENFRRIYRLV